MVKRIPIHEKDLKIVLKKRDVQGENFQRIQSFSHHLLRHTLRRPRRWEWRILRRKDLDINENVEAFIGVFLREMRPFQEKVKKEKLSEAKTRKHKKLPLKPSLSLIAQAPQKSRKKTKVQNELGKPRCHLKIC